MGTTARHIHNCQFDTLFIHVEHVFKNYWVCLLEQKYFVKLPKYNFKVYRFDILEVVAYIAVVNGGIERLRLEKMETWFCCMPVNIITTTTHL